MAFFVYYLLDPASQDLLYIGRSHRPKVRHLDFQRRTGRLATLGVCQRFSTIDQACSAELVALAKHKPPFNKRLASSTGRLGHRGATISEWHRQQVIKSRKGRTVSEETKDRTRASMLGKKLSEETKQKIREANLGKKQSPEAVAKRLATIKANKGISRAEGAPNGNYI